MHFKIFGSYVHDDLTINQGDLIDRCTCLLFEVILENYVDLKRDTRGYKDRGDREEDLTCLLVKRWCLGEEYRDC